MKKLIVFFALLLGALAGYSQRVLLAESFYFQAVVGANPEDPKYSGGWQAATTTGIKIELFYLGQWVGGISFDIHVGMPIQYKDGTWVNSYQASLKAMQAANSATVWLTDDKDYRNLILENPYKAKIRFIQTMEYILDGLAPECRVSLTEINKVVSSPAVYNY